MGGWVGGWVDTGLLDPTIGREEEVSRVMQVLVRRRKNNPCLVGDPGVGKTAIAEASVGQAQNILPTAAARCRAQASHTHTHKHTQTHTQRQRQKINK